MRPQEGIEKATEILETFQTTHNVELITSAYFDAEDRGCFDFKDLDSNESASIAIYNVASVLRFAYLILQLICFSG